MELISVIIPVYNGEKTIKGTIESVLQQTYAHFELIVINSDSSDGTFEIVSSIQDQRIKIYNYPKANAAVNRNRGLIYAKGEFVSFIDADDIWTADKLEAQYTVLRENPQSGLAYSWTDVIDELDKFVRPCSYATWQGDVYTKLLLKDFIASGSNVMIRKNILAKVGGFNESLTNAQDSDMWQRLAAITDFVCVPKVQILYRIIPNSMSSNVLGMEAAKLQIIESGFSSQKAKSLEHLKKYALSNLYQYLTFKSLEAPPDKIERWTSIRFLWNWVRYNPAVLKQRQTMLIAVFKIAFPRLYYSFKKFWKANN
ncbi:MULTISPECIES: glycosyltransferase [unclassified Anabaena]|uniref:glycosyltransferase n=1 Tax=unclassified Anabaena TaxID=2619674 RepID=UPI001445AAEF|nr:MULTISPECIES: glycosyltransferase [unclassified Anabaena]MTJ06633.1 glycosyltransferase [Anabaena sp. UHCC 0204]MTJ54405.1 glycosyltransferase [Anabaena sp. UHCC 0253]